METRDLEVLMHVVRLGSFAAAARELAVDPSSVSRSVAAIENELGARIFLRNTRHISLTEAGQVFVERLPPLLPELAEARSAALDAVGTVTGRLRITASNAFAVRWLSPRLPAFCRSHPLLELDVLLTESHVDLVSERVDVALRLGNLRDSSLVAVPVLDVRYRAVASPEWVREQGQKPRTPQDLQAVQCLCFALPGFRDHWQFAPIDGGESIDVWVRPRIVATNALLVRESALAGLGPTLLADWLIGEDLLAGRLVDLFPGYVASTRDAPGTAWAVYPSRKHVPAKVRAFVDYVRTAAA